MYQRQNETSDRADSAGWRNYRGLNIFISLAKIIRCILRSSDTKFRNSTAKRRCRQMIPNLFGAAYFFSKSVTREVTARFFTIPPSTMGPIGVARMPRL